MKLDKIAFANLIAHIQYWIDRGNLLSPSDIDDINFIINFEVPPNSSSNASDVDELLKHLNSPNGIIPAIKAYRVLTGMGLKESKDAIERYRNVPNFPPKQEGATLGDILRNATNV